MQRIKKLAGLGLLLLLAVGCYKIEDSTATITVIDQNENRVQGAVVHVFPSSTEPGDTVFYNPGLDQTKTTDNNGQVFFDYTEYFKNGQVGLFVLDYEVSYQAPDSLIEVMGVIKIEEQKHNEKTVELPFNL